MGEENIKKEDIIKFLESEYIKEGWIGNGDCIDNLITEDIVNCINKCASPAGNSKEEKLEAIFRAFSLFPMSETKVLIIGQDPYPDENRACGLAFSFKNKDIPADDSLLNIFKAIVKYRKYKDIKENNDTAAWNTNLENWAKNKNNKVLLLNTALTYKDNEEHFSVWKEFVMDIISRLLITKINGKDNFAVFLWGIEAQNIFAQSLNRLDKEHINEFKNIDIIKDNRSKKKIRFKCIKKLIKGKKPLKSQTGNIKLYMTSHPSNNHQSVKKGFSDDAPKHFECCDKFLGDDIWLKFPENNK